MNATQLKTLAKIIKFLDRESGVLGESDLDQEIKDGLDVARRALKRSHQFASGVRKAEYTYRIVVKTDDVYNMGDDENQNETDALIDQYGLWFYVVERSLVDSMKWTDVDSCGGFLGDKKSQDAMIAQAFECIPEHINEVEILDEHLLRINTAKR